jgi:hypothetical protein
MRYIRVLNRKPDFDDDIYEEVWLPVGDEKNKDINRLIVQGRINS